MNRRRFFGSLLGAACLAVAERVLPSALAKPVAEVYDGTQTELTSMESVATVYVADVGVWSVTNANAGPMTVHCGERVFQVAAGDTLTIATKDCV